MQPLPVIFPFTFFVEILEFFRMVVCTVFTDDFNAELFAFITVAEGCFVVKLRKHVLEPRNLFSARNVFLSGLDENLLLRKITDEHFFKVVSVYRL